MTNGNVEAFKMLLPGPCLWNQSENAASLANCSITLEGAQNCKNGSQISKKDPVFQNLLKLNESMQYQNCVCIGRISRTFERVGRVGERGFHVEGMVIVRKKPVVKAE
uniref:Uncharacterized protein n=1 Tax=Romanomermis culicivorax TaxID=13658 RepID=A0A915IDX3_ROMCU